MRPYASAVAATLATMLTALLLSVGAAAATAQDRGPDDGSSLTNRLDLEGRLERIEELRSSLERVEPWERDGLSYRIDQLSLRWLDELLAVGAERLSEPDPGDGSGPAGSGLVDRAVALVLERDAALRARIATERGSVGKFEVSPQADIARAFMEDLTRLRLAYLARLADLAEVGAVAGPELEAAFAQGREGVTLLLERLTGQIRLDALSLQDLRNRLSESPTDEELQTAAALVRAKQSRNLENLEGLVPTAERFGFDTAEQRGLLIQERGQVGLDLLEREVFSTIWRDRVASLRTSLASRGPDVVFRLTLFVLILLAAWLLAKPVRFAARVVVDRDRLAMSVLLRDLVVSGAGSVVLLSGLVLGLLTLGLSLGPLFAGLGVLGLVVGLAVQDSLGNFAAGTMILLYRPYDVDDLIMVSGAEGLVKRMNLVATTIATFDNQSVTIPNGRIWGDTIVNFTAHRTRRVDLGVSFAYSEDPDRVRDVLLDVVTSHDKVLKTPKPLIHMGEMEDSALTMMVKPWVRTEDYWATLWELRRIIKKRFDAEGIEIPFPQRVVTLRDPGGREPPEPADVRRPPAP